MKVKKNFINFAFIIVKNMGRTYINDYTGDSTIPAFVTFYIEQYKKFKNISGEEAMQRLSDAAILDYLAENYDILHLESHHWLLKEIDKMVESKVLDKL